MSLKKSLQRIHELHDIEPTTVNKGVGWEATQHFSGKFLIRFQYLLFFSFVISHALGTMHKLSVGVQPAFDLGCLAFYLYSFHLFKFNLGCLGFCLYSFHLFKKKTLLFSVSFVLGNAYYFDWIYPLVTQYQVLYKWGVHDKSSCRFDIL